jgi:hypothetical protein
MILHVFGQDFNSSLVVKAAHFLELFPCDSHVRAVATASIRIHCHCQGIMMTRIASFFFRSSGFCRRQEVQQQTHANKA